MSSVNLPVFLRGERNYVQASQILARTAEHLAASWSDEAMLRECSFRKLTGKHVAAELGTNPNDVVPGALGHAIFSKPGEVLKAHFMEMQDAAERRLIAERATVDRDPSGDPCVFLFRNATTFEDVIVVIVQALKRFHADLADAPYDLWFTGMRNAELAIGDRRPEVGEIEIELIRLMGTVPQFQSLCRVTVKGENAPNHVVPCTFAFRSQQAAHVH